MEQRLYFSAPNLDVAEKCHHLIQQIELADDNFSVVSLNDEELKNRKMPPADYTKKLDFVRCGLLGMAYGFAGGVASVVVLEMIQPYGFDLTPSMYWIPAAMCTSFGLWLGIMTGLAMVNHNLKPMQSKLKKGGSVIILDVSEDRVDEVKTLFHDRVPQAHFEHETRLGELPKAM